MVYYILDIYIYPLLLTDIIKDKYIIQSPNNNLYSIDKQAYKKYIRSNIENIGIVSDNRVLISRKYINNEKFLNIYYQDIKYDDLNIILTDQWEKFNGF